MDGSTHAATGFIAGLGLGFLVNNAGHHLAGPALPESIGLDVLFGLVTAGLALVPDSDHPDASFAHSAGGLSRGISGLVHVLFGGHRQGMHSLTWGVPILALATEACAVWWRNPWSLGGLALVLALAIAAGLTATGFSRKMTRRRRGSVPLPQALLLGCGVAALAVATIGPDLWWLVVLGMIVHIAEDEFTGHGCCLLWPFYRHRIGGDGKQPAKKAASSRRAPSGFKQAQRSAAGLHPRTGRPVTPRKPAAPKAPPAPRPPAGPRMSTLRPGPLLCLDCAAGSCDQCTESACKCPQAGAHTARPKRSRKAPAPAVPVGRPVLPLDPQDDPPPF